jgi:hypothetical protein
MGEELFAFPSAMLLALLALCPYQNMELLIFNFDGLLMEFTMAFIASSSGIRMSITFP